MNALVAIRSNQTGILSPTPEERDSVRQTLEATAASRAGLALGAKNAFETSGVGQTNESPGIAENELGKQTFLELLVLELQNQDPLEPVDNADMLAQLAQFSALEAQTNLNESFDLMSANVDQLNFISASQLLGKTVSGVDLNGELRNGVVESVHLDGSLVVLTVDGSLMSMAGILAIEPEGQGGGSGGESGDNETPRNVGD